MKFVIIDETLRRATVQIVIFSAIGIICARSLYNIDNVYLS